MSNSPVRDRAGRPGFDAQAVARAEAALKALSVNFDDWMNSELARLEAARAAARTAGYSSDSLAALHHRAHDVKGLGATYGYPLATMVSEQLCRLLDTPEGCDAARASPSLIDAHVDAVRAIVRAKLKSAEDPTGVALLSELKRQVDRWAKPD
jgi:hypothetical protein